MATIKVRMQMHEKYQDAVKGGSMSGFDRNGIFSGQGMRLGLSVTSIWRQLFFSFFVSMFFGFLLLAHYQLLGSNSIQSMEFFDQVMTASGLAFGAFIGSFSSIFLKFDFFKMPLEKIFNSAFVASLLLIGFIKLDSTWRALPDILVVASVVGLALGVSILASYLIRRRVGGAE
jgi:hypothetical protein